jgi:predicted nucleic acid-binding protein
MPAKVVDASAIGALLFNEPKADRISSALKGCELVAPTLLPYEVGSICLKKIAARPDDEEILMLGLDLLSSLPLRLVAVEAQETVAVAAKHKVTVYDAAYLWLAMIMEAELVTLDQTLARAWNRSRRS